MEWIVGILVALFLLALIYGGVTGRIRSSSGCCAPVDPAQDRRMAAAYDDDRVDPDRAT